MKVKSLSIDHEKGAGYSHPRKRRTTGLRDAMSSTHVDSISEKISRDNLLIWDLVMYVLHDTPRPTLVHRPKIQVFVAFVALV